MSDLDLGKQIGPLPLGAWIAVVAGGLGIALYTKNGGQASPYVVEDVGSPNVAPGSVGDGSLGGWIPTGPITGGPGPTVPPSGAILTNEDWARKAIEYLVASGYNAADAYSAITNAINGQQVSVSQFALWGAAIRGIGVPPFPVLVLPPTSVPSVAPEPAPEPYYEQPALPPPPPPPAPVAPGDTPHAYRPRASNDPHCAVCGRWRDTWVHTNRDAPPAPVTPPGDTPHRWVPISAVNRHCKVCGRWRNTWVHTNQND